MADKPDKPLGGKAYGSIPHLPGSRRGPGDRGITAAQAAIATTRSRDGRDRVYVQEKLDGSCVCVARVPPLLAGEGPSVTALSRAGYAAVTSPYPQHHRFAEWAYRPDNAAKFHALLRDGERLVGEWLYQAHGTRYALPHGPFVAFDLFSAGRRVPHVEFTARVGGLFPTPALLHAGGPLSVDAALALLDDNGRHGALDPAEGVVWRVERNGVVDFLCKYVRPGKTDGCYLPDITGGPEVLNEWTE